MLLVPVNPVLLKIAQAGPPLLTTLHCDPLMVRLSKLSEKIPLVTSGELDSTVIKEVLVTASLPAPFVEVSVTV